MRISGSGVGGGGGQNRPDSRKERFRRAHRVGDRLTGRLLRWQAEGLAWVEVDGQEMLARIESRPAPGQELAFLVLRLDPDIELKELADGGDPFGQAGPGGAPAMVLQGFWSLRNQLDSLLPTLFPLAAACAPPDAPAPLPDRATRKRAFLAAVGADARAMALYAALLDRQREINYHLAARNIGTLRYVPWLVPGARDQELFVTATPQAGAPKADIAFGCHTRALGAVLARLLHADGRTAVRLFVERPDATAELAALCATLLPEGSAAVFLGAGPLPPGYQGVLTGRLATRPGARIGINTRV
ncbi:MAG: hypothetical protein AB7E47_12000 [Desulfovibrionaceae bacterium]